MALTERGKVEGGKIIFPEPLALPDGTEVMVHIEPVTADSESLPTPRSEGIVSFPFVGMWADREELSESAAWVRREREQWESRARTRE